MDTNFFSQFINNLVPYIEDIVTAFILLMYRVIFPLLGVATLIAKFTPTQKDDEWLEKIMNIFRASKGQAAEARDHAKGKDKDLFDK